jgi:hypothetical protein
MSETGGVSLDTKKVIGQKDLLDPSAQIDPVQMDIEMKVNKDYLDQLVWLNEPRPVTILESNDEADKTNIVDISIQGKSYVFIRGVEKEVPRFVIDHLARAKSDRYNFDAQADPTRPDGVRTTNSRQSIFKFPHVFSPSGVREQGWYNAARQAHF